MSHNSIPWRFAGRSSRAFTLYAGAARGCAGLRWSISGHSLWSLVGFCDYIRIRRLPYIRFPSHLILSSAVSLPLATRSPASRPPHVHHQSRLFQRLFFGRVIFRPRIPLQARWYCERVQHMLPKLYFSGCTWFLLASLDWITNEISVVERYSFPNFALIRLPCFTAQSPPQLHSPCSRGSPLPNSFFASRDPRTRAL